MKFNSQICTTRVQSERLIALGVKEETADMGIYYSELYGVDRVFPNDVFNETPTFDSDEIPAWSLGRLWELLPKNIWHDDGLERKFHPIIEYNEVNYTTECGSLLFEYGKELWESMLTTIEWLIKEGYFNKEYLV